LPHTLQLVLKTLAWLVALSWLIKLFAAIRGLPTIPNLLLPQYNLTPPDNPTLTVIVPARNEAANIAATLESLLAQDYAVQIIAVNDRSTDSTGDIIDALARQHPTNLHALHVTQLPDGWLGKTHAMALAAHQASTDFLLFTDADVIFRSDAIRVSLANAVSTHADHHVTVPTPTIRRWDEAAMLGFFQVFSLWSARPWLISNPKATRDAFGVGAFNLLRREAYLAIGGYESLRMEIVEDLGIARRIKRAGLAQRIAFGCGLVNIHWASGANGLVEVLTKNIFSAFHFYISLALLFCLWVLAFCIAPFVGVFFSPTRLPSILTIAAIFYTYRLMHRSSGIPVVSCLFAPFSALLVVFTLLRSMWITLKQGGVIWRGTFYSLAELRKNAAPFF
jgi:glycosyltransferase involved in cell wall biosynthesis